MQIQRAAITGGAGFVGGAIYRVLRNRHPQCIITIIDLHPPNDPTYDGLAIFAKADVSQKNEISLAVYNAAPDVVFHCAGIVPPLHERHARRMESLVLRTNVDGTKNTIAAAKAVDCSAFVFTSSCTAVTDDLTRHYPNIDETWPVAPKSTVYGESKVLAEKLVISACGTKYANFHSCVLRPAVIFGERDPQLIPSLAACIPKKETPYIIGDGCNLWDTIYVGNVADAHVLAAENLLSSKTAAGQVFFIQNNEPIPFRAFCLAVWKQLGHIPPREIVIPASLCWLLGLLAEFSTWLSGATATLSRGSIKDASSIRYASGDKAERILGFKPRIGLEEGLRISCQDFIERYKSRHDALGKQKEGL